MLVSAAVCPHPPLLVPEVAGGAAPELDGLRAACDEAVGRLLAAGTEVLAVVGTGAATRTYDQHTGGDLTPYGAAVRVGRGEPVLPLSLTLGVWLLERSGWSGIPELRAIRAAASTAECLRLGAGVADRSSRVGLLVMGDGSARRSERAPGYYDSRAVEFDARLSRALAAGDAHELARADPQLADELLAAGLRAWQVLAGAAGEAAFDAELLADEAPYGVGYLVANWSRRE